MNEPARCLRCHGGGAGSARSILAPRGRARHPLATNAAQGRRVPTTIQAVARRCDRWTRCVGRARALGAMSPVGKARKIFGDPLDEAQQLSKSSAGCLAQVWGCLSCRVHS